MMSDTVAVQLIVSVSTLIGLIVTALLQARTHRGVNRVEQAVNGKSDAQLEKIEALRLEVEALKLGRRSEDSVSAKRGGQT